MTSTIDDSSMKVQYALTRSEMIPGYVQGNLKSPRFLFKLFLYAIGLALLHLVLIASRKTVTTHDILIAVIWGVGLFVFLPVWLFLRAKTQLRTLSISPDGISTTIGKFSGEVRWDKVREVKDAGTFVLITGKNGNFFFVPNRAFASHEDRARFLKLCNQWR